MNEKMTADNTKHINMKMDLDLFEKVQKMAKDGQRTVSGQIRFIIQEYISIKEKN